MSRGRKAIMALSAVVLAAGVALGGGQAASANGATTASSSELPGTYDGQSQARSAAAVPVEFRQNYRIANGKNTVNVNAIDKAGSPDVSIAVRGLKMQRLINSKWTTVAVNWDTDGWHNVNDAASLTVYCVRGASYRAQYSVEYRGGASGKGTVTTSSWSCPS